MSGTSDYTLTPNLQLFKPTYLADGEQWGNHWNANADTLDAAVHNIQIGALPISGGTISGPLTVTGRVTIQGGLTLTGLPINAANDAAAASAGVPVGGMYRNGSVLMVRVT